MRIHLALSVSLLCIGQQAAAQVAPSVTTQSVVAPSTNAVNVIQPPSPPSPRIIHAPVTTFGFGPGINCPTPALAINAFTSNGDTSSFLGNSNSSHVGASISLTIPLGGSVGNSCSELAETIAQQRALAHETSLVSTCVELISNNVTVDPAAFPELAVCSAVTLR